MTHNPQEPPYGSEEWKAAEAEHLRKYHRRDSVWFFLFILMAAAGSFFTSWYLPRLLH